MKTYKNWSPTAFDSKGLALYDDRKNWLVLELIQTRDSDCLVRSNFECAIKELGGERTNVLEVHRFGHWGPGWFEIILINPKAGVTLKKAKKLEEALENYPILDEDHYFGLQMDEALTVWKYFSNTERIDYIRQNYSDFSFRDFADLLGTCRGNYFCGYPENLLR